MSCCEKNQEKIYILPGCTLCWFRFARVHISGGRGRGPMSPMAQVFQKRATDEHLSLEVHRIMEPSSVKKGRPKAWKNGLENATMSGAKKRRKKGRKRRRKRRQKRRAKKRDRVNFA